MIHMTEEDFKGLFTQLEPDNKRQFTVMTGMQGMKLFESSMQYAIDKARQNHLIATIQSMFNANFISNHQQEKLLAMAHSPDQENWGLAECMLETCMIKNVTNE